jgi:hypothetical protein
MLLPAILGGYTPIFRYSQTIRPDQKYRQNLHRVNRNQAAQSTHVYQHGTNHSRNDLQSPSDSIPRTLSIRPIPIDDILVLPHNDQSR